MIPYDLVIDSSVRHCRQRLGCLRRVSQYLGSGGLILAYQAFVRPVAEYGNVLMMGASPTQLSRLDRMQHLAEQLCSTQFTPLEKRCHAAAIGLLCKLLD